MNKLPASFKQPKAETKVYPSQQGRTGMNIYASDANIFKKLAKQVGVKQWEFMAALAATIDENQELVNLVVSKLKEQETLDKQLEEKLGKLSTKEKEKILAMLNN